MWRSQREEYDACNGNVRVKSSEPHARTMRHSITLTQHPSFVFPTFDFWPKLSTLCANCCVILQLAVRFFYRLPTWWSGTLFGVQARFGPCRPRFGPFRPHSGPFRPRFGPFQPSLLKFPAKQPNLCSSKTAFSSKCVCYGNTQLNYFHFDAATQVW